VRCTHPLPLPPRSEARDIAQPSRTASESSERRGRLLRLALTDGKARCVGLELHPLPLSAEQARPPVLGRFPWQARGKAGLNRGHFLWGACSAGQAACSAG
jgi:hypothetical protein